MQSSVVKTGIYKELFLNTSTIFYTTKRVYPHPGALMEKVYRTLKKATIIFGTFCLAWSNLAARKGIVIVPVADLAGEPIHTYYTHQPTITAYSMLPWASYKKDYEACPRVHQLVYQEMVEIIGKRNDELLIKIPNIFYQTHLNATPQHYYWTLEKNIMPLADLPQATDIKKIPQSIQCNINNDARYVNTVSLIEPYTIPSIDFHLSAGTRFVKSDHQPHKDKVTVYYIHPKSLTIETLALPLSSVYIFTPQPMAARITAFLNILRHWAMPTHGIVPYVWGGCSFSSRLPTNNFTIEHTFIKNKKLASYIRSANPVPKTGYDCSSMIVRAAQIVGLPYYYKNTYTIAQHLPLLKKHESLKVGDLVWIRGHVLVVADLSKHTVIEAGAYDYGYGKVQEIAISKIFKNIANFDDLQQQYYQKKPLERLDKHGTVLDTYSEVKLFKFASQWT
jgi:hypothetical protein